MQRYKASISLLFVGIFTIFLAHNMLPHEHHSHDLDHAVIGAANQHHHIHHNNSEEHSHAMDLLQMLFELHAHSDMTPDHEQVQYVLKKIDTHLFLVNSEKDPSKSVIDLTKDPVSKTSVDSKSYTFIPSLSRRGPPVLV